MSRKLLPFLFFLLLGCASVALDTPVTLDELRIDVHGESRQIAFTNRGGGYLLSQTNAEHNPIDGWYVAAAKLLQDYEVEIDGKKLSKPDVHLAMVWPHQFQRAYPSGVQETVTLLDSVNAIIVEIDKIKGTQVALRPYFDSGTYETKQVGDVLLCRRQDSPTDAPSWIGIGVQSDQLTLQSIQTDVRHRDDVISPSHILGTLSGSNLTVVFATASSEEETVRLAQSVIRDHSALIAKRKMRMEQVLQRPFIRTDDSRINKALHWAILSLDALTNIHTPTIAHGLPWNGEIRVRDCLLSIPGALLVGGRYAEARSVLRFIAQHQETDPRSASYGLLPATISSAKPSFGAADVTPLFVSALYEYARHSNDTTFMREMYPAVKRSIEGTLRNRVDRNYFLKHGNLETWEQTPRGDRACEIQAIWSKQLQLGAVMAAFAGEPEIANRWNDIADHVGQNFNSLFVSPAGNVVYDHLRPDNSTVDQLHPSLLFTFDLLDNPLKRFTIFKRVTEELVHERGVHSPPRGIVPWMNGMWIDLATYYDMPGLSFRVTEQMVRQILEETPLGTIPETLQLSEIGSSTTAVVSHSAGLAEFVRSFYQSYLGVYVDGSVPRLILRPQLPPEIKNIRVRIPIEIFVLEIEYRLKSDKGELVIISPPGGKNVELHVSWNLPQPGGGGPARPQSGGQQNFDIGIERGSTVVLTMTAEKVVKEVNGVSLPVNSTTLKMTGAESVSLASDKKQTQ